MAQTKAQLLGPVVGDVVMDVSTLSLDAEGNKVGIGTTGATATLHVFEPTEGDAVVQFNSGDNFPTVNRGLVIKSATGPTGYTGSKWIFDAQSSGGRIEFQTTSTPRLTILESGNIGVGTDSPSVLLHLAATEPQFYIQDSNSTGNNVNATLQFRDSSNSQLAYLGFAGTSDSDLSLFNTMSGGDLRLGTGGTKRLSVNSDGSTTMHVNSENHQTFRFTTQATNEAKLIMRDANSNEDIVLNTGGSTYFNNDHNFGLGMSNPNAKLHIQKNSSDTDFTDETTPSSTSGVQIANLATGAGTFTALTLSVSSGSATQNASVIAKATSSGTAPEMHFTQRSNNNTLSRLVITSGGGLKFISADSPTSTTEPAQWLNHSGGMQLYASSGTSTHRNIIFCSASNAASERLRITSAGHVTMGVPDYSFNNAKGFDTYLGMAFNQYDGGILMTSSSNLYAGEWSFGLEASASHTHFVILDDANERLRITSDGQLLHTRTDNTTRYDLEFRNTGGISDGNYGGIHWSQGSTGSTNLAAIEIAYADTGRPDIVFKTRQSGGNSISEAVRIDSSGRLLINKDTNRDKYFNGTYSGQLQVEGTNDSTRLTQFVHNQNTASQPILILGKSRGSTVGSYTAVQNGDYLGTVSFQGADGDEMVDGARIDGIVNGTPSNDNMPTDIVFRTNQAKERLRISNTGELSISGSRSGNNISDAILKFNIVNSNGDGKKAEIKAIKTADITSELIFSTTVSHTFAERMRIGSTGCLNIGGNFTQTDYTAQVTRHTGNTDVMQIKGNTGNSFIRFTDSDASSDFSLGADDAVGSNGFVLYDRNDSEYRVSVDTNGNIGIGLGSAGAEARLHVEENLSHSSTYYLNADAHILVDNPGSGKSVLKLEGEAALVYGGGSSKFFVADRQFERFRINEYGNAIYQGTLTPNNGLTANAGFLIRGKTVDGSSSTVDLNISQASSTNGVGLEIQEPSNGANALATLVFNHGSLKAMIGCSRVVTNQWGTDLRFYTHPDSTDSAHQHKVYERLRITSGGQFQIGGGSSINYLKNQYQGAVSVTGTNNESFAFEIQGSAFAAGGLLYFYGTSGNVVVNVSAEILVNHSNDVTIKSMSGAYTQARIRVKTDSNARAAIYLGRSAGYASGTTSLNWRFIPYGGTYLYTTESTNSGTDHTHTTSSGSFRITAAGGGAGNVNASGSKNFMIDHPLESLRETTRLAHAAVEGPECNTIYRGKVDLVDGTATVNIDTNSRMTEGTFEALNQNIQCFTTNETGWTAIKGSVSGNLLTITAQDNTCTDTISWMVVGERHDQDIIDNKMTDSEGRFIPEVTDEYDPSQFPEYVAPVEPEQEP